MILTDFSETTEIEADQVKLFLFYSNNKEPRCIRLMKQ